MEALIDSASSSHSLSFKLVVTQPTSDHPLLIEEFVFFHSGILPDAEFARISYHQGATVMSASIILFASTKFARANRL